MTYRSKIDEYVCKVDGLMKSLLYSLEPLARKEHGLYQEVTVPLFMTLHSTSESILILVQEQSLPDADVLLRTVMEGTIKYCYLMTGNVVAREEKFLEYKVKLTEIAKLADHRKAKETTEILQKHTDNSTVPFEYLILSDEEITRIEQTYSKKERTELQQNWSYSSLLRNLAKNSEEYAMQIGTLSTYSLTSHFGHFDWEGLQNRINQAKQAVLDPSDKVNIGHAIRILSNVLNMYIFRVLEYLRGNNCYSEKTKNFALETVNFIAFLNDTNNKIIKDEVV